MIQLSDALIDQLAHQETSRAYGHEVKAMAQEIQTYRTAAAEAAKKAAGSAAQSSNLPLPWPYGGPLGAP